MTTKHVGDVIARVVTSPLEYHAEAAWQYLWYQGARRHSTDENPRF
jgi:hypothetical protein